MYYAAFNHVDPGLSNVFATVGGNEVHVYALQAAADGPETPEPLQCFVDENAEECFYSVEWTFKQPGGDPVILCAGTSGIIKAIQCSSGKVDSFVGHGGDVYEVKTNPLNPDIFLSVSKDKSCRIWSLALGCCLAILAGEDGHGEEVLSADFDDEGRVLTSGMDHTVKIWDLTPEIQKFVETSDPSFLGVSATNVEKHKIVKYLQFPRFTGNIHSNYVDCVRAYGHFVLSKSVEEKISLWRPEQKKVYIFLSFPCICLSSSLLSRP